MNLTNIISEGKQLSSVSVYVHPDLPNEHVALSLKFDGKIVFIEALDDDTLNISSKLCSDEYIELEYGNNTPFKQAIGQPLRWAWEMTNNNGYLDGVQMEFAESVSSDANIIQIQIIASRIDYRLVTQIEY